MDELNIPIFKKAYDLYKTFHDLRSNIPKQDRYALWQRIENTSLSFIEQLFRAGQRGQDKKSESLEIASVELNMLRILLRLAKDTKVIDLKKYVQIQQTVDEIGRMLGGWIKSARLSSSTPPPTGIFKLKIKERRKCRTDEDQRLSFRLSSQLLLTLSRPSLKLSSTRLPSAVCTVPLSIH